MSQNTTLESTKQNSRLKDIIIIFTDLWLYARQRKCNNILSKNYEQKNNQAVSMHFDKFC